MRRVELSLRSCHPAFADFHIGVLYGSPGDSMRPRFPITFARMSSIGVIERFAVNILRMMRQMRSDRLRQVTVRFIWHRRFPYRLGTISTRFRHDFDFGQNTQT